MGKREANKQTSKQSASLKICILTERREVKKRKKKEKGKTRGSTSLIVGILVADVRDKHFICPRISLEVLSRQLSQRFDRVRLGNYYVLFCYVAYAAVHYSGFCQFFSSPYRKLYLRGEVDIQGEVEWLVASSAQSVNTHSLHPLLSFFWSARS